jgi:thermitase
VGLIHGPRSPHRSRGHRVDLKHPDLAKKLVVTSNADMVDPKQADGPLDENGHGTHVAGIAGAITNNGIGVAGTAPNARILPVRVLDAEGSGTADQVAAGIRFAADQGPTSSTFSRLPPRSGGGR